MSEQKSQPPFRSYSSAPDRGHYTDEAGEWEITGHPYTLRGGKTVHARVKQIGELAVTEERSWGAHERVAVRLRSPLARPARSAAYFFLRFMRRGTSWMPAG
jgi:hypothetical protein